MKVGVDAFGKGGASVTKGQVNAGNGMVLGINSVIDVPPDLGASVSSRTQQRLFLIFISNCCYSAKLSIIFR